MDVYDDADAITYEIRGRIFFDGECFARRTRRVYTLTEKQAREVLMYGVTGTNPFSLLKAKSS